MFEMLIGKNSNVSDGPPGVEFLGEVGVNNFINGADLASLVGLTAGIPYHPNTGWLHFILDGKTILMAKRPFRHTISWGQLDAVGIVFGSKTVVIDEKTYKVRLPKGSSTDPYVGTYSQDQEGTWGSEWNRLMYPLIPNPTNKPAGGLSGEGILYGSLGNYTEIDLTLLPAAGNGHWSWCQETPSASSTERLFRGLAGVSRVGWSKTSDSRSGWRPVLELIE